MEAYLGVQEGEEHRADRGMFHAMDILLFGDADNA